MVSENKSVRKVRRQSFNEHLPIQLTGNSLQTDVGSETQPSVQVSSTAFGLARRTIVLAVIVLVLAMIVVSKSVGAVDPSKEAPVAKDAPAAPSTSTMAAGLNTAEATLKRMSDEIYDATQAAYAKASAGLVLLSKRGSDATTQGAKVMGDAILEKKTEASDAAKAMGDAVLEKKTEAGNAAYNMVRRVSRSVMCFLLTITQFAGCQCERNNSKRSFCSSGESWTLKK